MNPVQYFIPGLAISLSLAFGVLAQDENALSLDEMVSEALKNNPHIKAAESHWRAYQARPAQVSSLPDPMLSYTRFGASVETRLGPQESILMLSQKIPFPGKLALKGSMAKEDAVAQQQSYEATIRDIVFKVKTAYFDLYRVDQSLTILAQYLNLLEDFTKVAEQKYATGQGIQANVLKSQVEISGIMERRFHLQKMREGAAARLNALLGRPQNDLVGSVSYINTLRIPLKLETLIARALAQREALRAGNAMVSKSEQMKRLAKKNYLPDFNLQMNYIDISEGVVTSPEAGKNAWSVMAGLNLPIWFGKRNAAVREADEMIISNRMNYENLENQIKAEVRNLFYQLELTGKTLDLYEQALIAQAETSLESAVASYRTGKLDFLGLLDAERMLLNLKLNRIKEQANYQKQLAAMEKAIGGEKPLSSR